MSELTPERRITLLLTEANGCIAVRCAACNSPVGDPCRKGGESYPEMADRPHKRRREDALLVRWWREFGEHS